MSIDYKNLLVFISVCNKNKLSIFSFFNQFALLTFTFPCLYATVIFQENQINTEFTATGFVFFRWTQRG